MRLTNDKTTAIIRAGKNPDIVKPSTKLAIKSSIRAFITRLKRPSVKICIGKDKRVKSGLIVTLRSDHIKITMIAIYRPESSTPSTNLASKTIVSKFSKNLIIIIL